MCKNPDRAFERLSAVSVAFTATGQNSGVACEATHTWVPLERVRELRWKLLEAATGLLRDFALPPCDRSRCGRRNRATCPHAWAPTSTSAQVAIGWPDQEERCRRVGGPKPPRKKSG